MFIKRQELLETRHKAREAEAAFKRKAREAEAQRQYNSVVHDINNALEGATLDSSYVDVKTLVLHETLERVCAELIVSGYKVEVSLVDHAGEIVNNVRVIFED